MPAVRAVFVLSMLLALLVFAAWVLQDRLIYLPAGNVGTPEDAGLPEAQELALPTEDGLTLDAWYVPPTGEVTGAAVLVLPGNAGNRAHRAPLARALSRAGLSVLLLDYRGYGGNPGRPSESGLGADARAAYKALSARGDVERVVVFGESLGAAVAVDLAQRADIHALVLRSPFTSLRDVARVHYPFLPAGALLRDRFDVEDAVRRVGAPVVVIAGARDSIVPPEQSRQVARAAGAELIEVAEADHNDPSLGAGEAVVRAIVAAAR
jgi:uncharacterized protein